MGFTAQTAIKNIKRKPARSAAMIVLVFVLSFTVFLGAFLILSLKKGLQSYQARLGADVVVVPASTAGHGVVDDIFLQGITGNYYMSAKDIDKVSATEGVAAVSRQFFLTSAKTSCCSVRVQIIGFEPETDFSIQPWIGESYAGTLKDGEVIVGADLNLPADRKITFYGETYFVAAQLDRTGTGLDKAVYTNMTTIRQMAENAANLLDSTAFKGVDINTAASALLIKVAPGYEIQDVADDINIHITKADATAARDMISDIAKGLSGVSRIIGILIVVVWVLAIVILAVVFLLLAGERRKEFAVLRVIGASRKMLSAIVGREAFLLSAVGSAAGLAAGLAAAFPLSRLLQDRLNLPMLRPSGSLIILLAAAAFVMAVLAGCIVSGAAAGKITGDETGLLLKEDA